AIEIGTYASVSGDVLFGGTGAHNLKVSAGSGALTIGAYTLGGTLTGNSNNITGVNQLSATTINAFTLGGALTGNSQNATGFGLLTGTQASTSQALEIGTYASISGNLNFGGTGVHTIQTMAGSGALTINAYTLGGALNANNNTIGTVSTLTATTINGFTLGGAITGSSNNVTGIGL